MAGVNRWYGIGNLTSDPTMKQGDREDGSNDRCEFSIAVNKPQGRSEREPEPTYIDMVAWGKLAGQVDKYARKGRLIYVEGELEVRKWKDKETDENRKAYRIKAYVVRFLDKAQQDDDRDSRRRDDDEPRRRSRDEDEPRRRERSYKAEDFDDLPF